MVEREKARPSNFTARYLLESYFYLSVVQNLNETYLEIFFCCFVLVVGQSNIFRPNFKHATIKATVKEQGKALSKGCLYCCSSLLTWSQNRYPYPRTVSNCFKQRLN